MIADLVTFLTFAAALTTARVAAHCWGRHVAARLAEEHADEKERLRWLGIVGGPRRDGEVYA